MASKAGKKASKRHNKLSITDRKIIKNVLEGMSYEEAGKLALPEAKAPRQSVYQYLQKPAVRSQLDAELQRIGLDDRGLAKEIKSLIKNKEPRVVRLIGSKEKIAVKTPNLDAKARGIDMAAKMRGVYAPQRHEVIRAEETQEELKAVLREVCEGCERCRTLLAIRLSGQSDVTDAQIVQDIPDMEEKSEA